jgi:hypothetical protein
MMSTCNIEEDTERHTISPPRAVLHTLNLDTIYFTHFYLPKLTRQQNEDDGAERRWYGD